MRHFAGSPSRGFRRLAHQQQLPKALRGGLTSLGENSQPENQAARLGITANFDHEFQRIKGIEHSAWAAVNAVSQYVDWERPSRGKSQVERDERRLSSTFVGQGAELKRKAWMAALTLIGAN